MKSYQNKRLTLTRGELVKLRKHIEKTGNFCLIKTFNFYNQKHRKGEEKCLR